MADETTPSWRMLSEEVLTGMKEWRQAHPKARLFQLFGEAMGKALLSLIE